MRKPNFFIVGAPKCGTTAMYQYLRQHPEIYMARKELNYFGGAERTTYPKGRLEDYLRTFGGATDEKWVGEASVFYLFSRVAAANIKEFCPYARVIVMLRNPVDMLPSLHSQLLYNGDEDIDDFEIALSLQSARKNGQHIPRHCHTYYGLQYYEVAAYTSQLERYYTAFGRDNVHVIIYDEFASDTPKSYRNVLDFLGVDNAYIPSSFEVVNPNKSIRVPWLRTALYVYRDSPSIRRPVQLLMPPVVRHPLRDLVRHAYTNHTPRSQISPELRRHLQQHFLPEVERLSALLGRDLTGWCTEKT